MAALNRLPEIQTIDLRTIFAVSVGNCKYFAVSVGNSSMICLTFSPFRDSEDVTEKIEHILFRIGRRLHESNMRKNYKMETRSWRNFGGASKDDIWSKTALTIFSALWQCYIISSIKWKHSIKDVHSALLNTQQVSLFLNQLLLFCRRFSARSIGKWLSI